MTKALMTIHGFLTDVNDFGRLYDYALDYDEIVPFVVPGHAGKGDFSKFTVDATIKALLSCYDDLAKRHKQIDVAGFSMGGALATYLCTKRDVHKVVLLAPANKYFNVTSGFSAIRFYLNFLRKVSKTTKGKLPERYDAIMKAIAEHKANVDASAAILINRFLPNLTLHTFGVFVNLISMINKTVEASKTIATPAYVLWGKLDELVPRSSVDYVCKFFSDCQTKIYEDIGHTMLYTNRDDVIIKDVLCFLSDGQVDVEIPSRLATNK